MITQKDIKDILEESYYIYALKTISDRAIPHIYDGLKPVQRRIIYTLYLEGPKPNQQHKKCARVVGSVLGKFHPHSDGSVYGALVNMTQEYMNYPLIDGQGNFGTRSEDPPAAMRYTECRLHKNAIELLLKDLESEPECTEYKLNYDQTEKEPIYLPARFPIVLLNGVQGIAVSIRSAVISHNIKEIANLTINALYDQEEEAFENFRGPDFDQPLCINMSLDEKKKIFYEGAGTIILKAKLEEIKKKNKTIIKVWTIPPVVSRKRILEQLTKLKKNLRIDFYTYSKPNKPKIEIVFKNTKSDPIKILYSKTSLKTSFTYDLTVLDESKPKKIGVWPLLKRWVVYRQNVLKKKFNLELKRILEDIEFYELVKKVSPKADELLKILRLKGINATREYLRVYSKSEKAINRLLSVRITFFSKETLKESEEKLRKLNKRKDELIKLLNDENELKKYIENELLEISNKYNDRLCKIESDFSESRDIVRLPIKISISDNKLIVGQGHLYDPMHSIIFIGEKGLYKLKAYELNRYNQKMKLDPQVLSQNQIGKVLAISLNEEAIIVYNKRESYLINLKKARNFSFRVKEYPKGFIAKDYFILSSKYLLFVTKKAIRLIEWKNYLSKTIFKKNFPAPVIVQYINVDDLEQKFILIRSKKLTLKYSIKDLLTAPIRKSGRIELIENETEEDNKRIIEEQF